MKDFLQSRCEITVQHFFLSGRILNKDDGGLISAVSFGTQHVCN